MVQTYKFTFCTIYLCLIWNGNEANSYLRNFTTCNLQSNHKYKTYNAVAVTTSSTKSKVSGKWQVGRVSRKQYEIINMLYRKTKTFLETGTAGPIPDSNKLSIAGGFFYNNNYPTATPLKPLQDIFTVVHPRPPNRPLTPSYIEFYYLDESDDRVKRKTAIPSNSKSEHQNDDYKVALLRPPFFLFRVNDATCKPTTLQHMPSQAHKNKQFLSQNRKEMEKSKEKHYIQDKFAIKDKNKVKVEHKTNITEDKKLAFVLKNRFTTLVNTRPYDRIKFFEIYDSGTCKPPRLLNDKINMINNNINNDEKIHLDQVDHDTDNHDGNNVTRYVKKHVNYKLEKKIYNVPQDQKINESTTGTLKPIKITKFRRPASWLEFPFVAVYVYEPMQVRCDSASISSHWLVATATCLHRHHRNPNSATEGRSAFVTYCGDKWKLPARIAYVKRTFIHPRFQAKDISRRNSYNIGVIQVVNSMANTCNGWRPVSMMSHQFVADQRGSFATTVGWGLDRHDTRFGSFNLPSNPLMVYEGLVFSNSCPGNADYRRNILRGERMKNLYCLSLPTYDAVDNDTVHGGLLLIGGKLIALYLQEERRAWGAQSALYTGIWRLIPWLLDMAREEEELDIFVSDM